jgi:hypothetical protein
MRVIFDHVRPSGCIMPVMQVIEAQSAWSWGLTITSITSMCSVVPEAPTGDRAAGSTWPPDQLGRLLLIARLG